ncbi:MAG: type II toxin-antitoxin system VapC family toxin [Bacteroidales bacterium]|nr:type II toxin-antitoxin system VapC family toxin [Bacteroidales bacterium]MCF8456238.1 type II toxin-antitoxin system VapC family toxin [Bacteroidales bacterium]
MGIKYLWDTNIAIYYLQDLIPPSVALYIDGLILNSPPAISVISEIELLCWKTTNPDDIEILKSFINDCYVYELNNQIKMKTAEIRKQHRVKLPDAIIAATAIVFNLTLLSINSKDFKNIEELKIVDPFEFEK